MVAWRSMSSSAEMPCARTLAGGCKGAGESGQALQSRGRALNAPTALRCSVLRPHRATHCAPCGRSIQTSAMRMMTNALRAGRKPCAPRRSTGAPGPLPPGLCGWGGVFERYALRPISLAASPDQGAQSQRLREAQTDGRRAQRASSADWSRLFERSACRARSELRDATVGRASQRIRAQHRPLRREHDLIRTCCEAGLTQCGRRATAWDDRIVTTGRQKDTP